MRTSNYPTQQALFFNQQQLPLPGMPPDPIYLNAGYIPDIFWSQINGIYIACPQGDDVSWFIDLSPEETLQEPSEFRFPTTAEPEISKVRVRKTEQEMEEIADESKR